MKHAIAHLALLVREYDEAIAFYTEKLGFTLVEDTYQAEQDKRWVVIAPAGSTDASLLLARARRRTLHDAIRTTATTRWHACQWSVCKACSSRSCTSSSDVCEKSSYH